MITRYDEVWDEDEEEFMIQKSGTGEYVLYDDMVELLATLGYNIEDLS